MMRAVVVAEPGNARSVTIKEVPIPVPKSGQVLVQVWASPIHPADLSFIKNLYHTKATTESIPGIEGSGTVVESGGGLLPWLLKGKRVAFMSKTAGAWADYIVVNATHCVVLPDSINPDQGSLFFANPCTCCMFMDLILSKSHKTVLQSGAASTCGKMLFRYCQVQGIQVINIVYRQEQVQMLQTMGAEYVLCSEDPEFETTLKSLCLELKPTIAFDCVAGAVTGQMLSNLCDGSVLYMYGFLSMKPAQVLPEDLLFQNKRIEGLLFSQWLQKQSFLSRLRLVSTVLHYFSSVFYSDVSRTFPLAEVQDAFDCFRKSRSLGKVVLHPNSCGMSIVWLLCFLAMAAGKLVAPLISFSDTSRWAYVTKFTLLEGRGLWNLKAKVHRPANETSTERAFLFINVYQDDQFEEALHAGDCKAQTKLAREKRVKVPLNGEWSPQMTGTLNQLKRVHIWYFAVSDCDGTLPERVKLRVEMTMHTRDGSEFSYEDEGLVYIFPIGTGLFALALSASLFNLWRRFKRTEDTDSRQLCLGLAIGMEFLSLFFQSIHLTVYSYNGYGVVVLDFFAQTLEAFSQLLVTIVMIIISAGWTLKYREFPDAETYVPVILGTVVMHLVLIGVGKVSDDAHYKFTDFEGTVGWLIIAARLLLWFWFLWNIRSLQKTVKGKTNDFVVSFSLFSSLYFLALPGAVLLSFLYPPYQRNTVLAITMIFVQMVSFWLLNELFSDKSTYFKVSTASEGVLPGKIR